MTAPDTAPQRALLLSVIAALLSALSALTASPGMADPTSEPTADDSATESVTGPDRTAEPDPVAGEVVRIAGESDPVVGGYSGDNGPAIDARLGDSLDVAAAPDGTTYVADWHNHRLRAIDPDGTITTVARNAPLSVDVDADGSVVVGGREDITRLAADGEEVLVAGGGENALPAAGERAPARSIAIDSATDVAGGANGTVHAVTTQRSRIIAVDPDGQVRLLAGGGDLDPADADGSRPATDYAMGTILALTVADTGTFADTVFLATEQQGHVLSIAPDGNLDITAGTGEIGFSGDGAAARNAALSQKVSGLAISPAGDLLIGDSGNGAIRRVDASGVIFTVQGSLEGMGRLDAGEEGVVLARGAQVHRVARGPETIAVEPALEPSTADPFADRSAGDVVHLAGADGELPAPPPDVYGPVSPRVTVDADGAILVGDPHTATVRRVESDGRTSPVAGVWPVPEGAGAGSMSSASSPESVIADEHVLGSLTDLATRPDGTVLIAEQDRVWELGADGTMTRLAFQGADLGTINAMATDKTGVLYLADGNLVRRAAPDGTLHIIGGGEPRADDDEDRPATESTLGELRDIAVDSKGNVYLTERGSQEVRRLSPDGVVTTVVGQNQTWPDEGGFSGDGGPGAEAALNTPTDLLVGPDDEVYVADTFNARVRRLDPDGTVTTVAGNGLLPGEHDATGPATDTALGEPTSLALDGAGDLVIAAARPGRVHRLTAAGTLEPVTEVEVPDASDEEAPTTEVVLPGALDVAVGAEGRALITAEDHGVWTVSESLNHSTTPASRIASGDRTFAATSTTVSRLLPDGRSVLVAGGGSQSPGEEPTPALNLDIAPVQDVAAGPDDSVFVLSGPTEGRSGSVVNHVTSAGSATPVPLHGIEELTAIAAAPDGTVYGIDAHSKNVWRLGGETDPTAIVTQDPESTSAVAETPFGDASALPPSDAQDLAVSPDGTLFVAVSEGLLAVDPQEDTYAFHGGLWDGEQDAARVSADRHGNAYVLSHHGLGGSGGLSALVHPAETAAPTQTPWTGIAVTGGSVVVLFGAVLLWRRRRRADHTAHGP